MNGFSRSMCLPSEFHSGPASMVEQWRQYSLEDPGGRMIGDTALQQQMMLLLRRDASSVEIKSGTTDGDGEFLPMD